MTSLEQKLKVFEHYASMNFDEAEGYPMTMHCELTECLAMLRKAIEQRNGWRLQYQNAVGIAFTHRAEVAASENAELLKVGEG